ncbi:hypothetical protein QOZ80_8AG0624770 [Eleusine coracana subsp. coracana]|nr:hypothetical protein QOZ80_8AG0624770 [Eleusine coracana subsp. coracana]
MVSRAALLVCASVLLAAAASSQAKNDVVVGGHDHGWKVPVQPNGLNLWSSIHRFQIGDNLVFKYDDASDSVLEVTRDDYNRCSTASPLATHKAAGAGSGQVAVPLPRSGPFYFISGKPGSCQMGERVVVVVMSDKHSHRGFFAPASAPSMPAVEGPAAAPAPATGAAAGRATSGAAAALLGAAVLGAAVLVGM